MTTDLTPPPVPDPLPAANAPVTRPFPDANECAESELAQTPPGAIRGPKLHSVSSIRKEAARQYRRYLLGKLSAADLSRVVAALAVVGALVRDSELESRLRAVELAQEPWRHK